jgi:hypothetical protein
VILRDPDSSVVPALSKALDENLATYGPMGAEHIIEALGRMGADAVPILVPLTKDDNLVLQMFGARALKKALLSGGGLAAMAGQSKPVPSRRAGGSAAASPGSNGNQGTDPAKRWWQFWK